MQPLTKRFGVVGGFALLLLVLAGNALLTRRQLGIQMHNRDLLAHNRAILLELTRADNLIRESESSQRGYLYTGDPKYLVTYSQSVGRVDGQMQTLLRLVADPADRDEIGRIRALAQQKTAELARTVSLYQSGHPDQAKALVVSDQGLNVMNEIESRIDSFQHALDTRATSQLSTFQQSFRFTVVSIYLASTLAAVGIILLAYYILREMALRELHARLTREREEWFRVTLTSLGDAVIATDQAGKVTFLNAVAEQLTGISLANAVGKPVDEVFPIFNEYTQAPVQNPVKKVMDDGNVIGLANHTVLRNSSGALTPIEDSAAPIRDDQGRLIGVVLVFRDATHERKSQEILRKTEKLTAAARLASTFAHEINNPLAAVVNLVYIVKSMAGLPAAAIQPLEMAEQELDRVSHITRQTLGFYRESAVPGPVELPAIIDSILRLYSNKFRAKNIRIETELGECPPVQGLAGELTQAISNLISNAADAVEPSGSITLKLSCVKDAVGLWARLVVKDDGPGIAPELRERIFEPFFTTKTDVGTGLGLWVTHEIISRHGGSIDVAPSDAASSGVAISGPAEVSESAAHGAEFIVLLPCTPIA